MRQRNPVKLRRAWLGLKDAKRFQAVQGDFYFLGLVDLEGIKEVLLWVTMSGEEQEGLPLALRVKASLLPLLLVYAWITVSESWRLSLIFLPSLPYFQLNLLSSCELKLLEIVHLAFVLQTVFCD